MCQPEMGHNLGDNRDLPAGQMRDFRPAVLCDADFVSRNLMERR